MMEVAVAGGVRGNRFAVVADTAAQCRRARHRRRACARARGRCPRGALRGLGRGSEPGRVVSSSRSVRGSVGGPLQRFTSLLLPTAVLSWVSWVSWVPGFLGYWVSWLFGYEHTCASVAARTGVPARARAERWPERPCIPPGARHFRPSPPRTALLAKYGAQDPCSRQLLDLT